MSSTFAYFGHHKCASTWIQYLTGRLSELLGLRHEVLDNPRSFGGDLHRHVREHQVDFFSYTNAEWAHVAPLPDTWRGFHLIRDPRDIVVSAYFSHRYSHPDAGWPELARIRDELGACSKSEGLIRTIDNLADLPVRGMRIPLFDSMTGWHYDSPSVLELRYEQFIVDPYKSFLNVLRFLGLLDDAPFGLRAQLRWLSMHVQRRARAIAGFPPKYRAGRRIPLPLALQIVYRYSFERISGGRKKGQESKASHFRKGVAGDWRNHFDDAVVAHFKRRTGPLLSLLGYETGPDWTAAVPRSLPNGPTTSSAA